MNAHHDSAPGPLVLYVIDSLAPGGAESSLAAMAPGLIDRSVRLEIVSLIPRPGLQESLWEAGATVTELRGSRATWWRQLCAIARDRRPDLVHTTLFEADLAGRLGARASCVPVVSTLANEAYGPAHYDEPGVREYRLRAAQVVDALTARLTTRLHAVSAHVADVMAKRLRYPRQRIDVIPRGRDPRVLGSRSEDRRARVRTRLGISVDTPVVLAVARQEHQKGLDVLIDAMPAIERSIPGTRVLVAGRPGAATPSLEERKRALGVSVEFLGSRNDVADLLCAADVFVLPSRREGMPGALLEAMALECPAVVSELPQTRELVDDRTAWITPPGVSDGVGKAVCAVLSDKRAAHGRAVAARQRFVARFTIDAVAQEMVRFYDRVLD